METQTRFDLNTALENWRQELAAQPNLTADDRRELETHLCDTVAELQRRGLNDEEAFRLARQRTGQPQKLSREFTKVEPCRTWRENVGMKPVVAMGIVLLAGFAALNVVTSGPRAKTRARARPIANVNAPPKTAISFLELPQGSGKTTAEERRNN